MTNDETKIWELAEKIVTHCSIVDSLRKPTPMSGG